MRDFKIGDCVKLTPEIKKFVTYNKNSKFIIIEFVGSKTVLLDKNLSEKHSVNFEGNVIHVDHLILDIKETRKQKIEKICLNQDNM